MYNACFAAFYNANRKKGKRALSPIRKARVKRADKNEVANNLSIIQENERMEGRGWIDLILHRNMKEDEKKEVK